MAAVPLDFTIWRATMVDETRGIPIDVAVEILALVQGENELVICLTSPHRFLFINLLAQILNNSCPGRGLSFSESAEAMNWRLLKDQPVGFGRFRFLEFRIHIPGQNDLLAHEFGHADE